MLIHVTLRHDFINAGRSGFTQGQVRNPDNPDHILESAAADKIRNYRDTSPQPARGFLAGVYVYLGPHPRRALALDLLPLQQTGRRLFCSPWCVCQPHKQEFCHRRGVFFQQNRGTIGLACAQALTLRGAPTTARRHVAAPRDLPPLHMPTTIMTEMSASSTASPGTCT